MYPLSMRIMKKAFYIIGLAALALASCTLDETYVNPDVPRVDKPMPVITYEGSGNLVTGEIGAQKTLKSTYAWEAKDNAIVINIGFDLEEYIENAGWELGYFFLDIDSINDYLGILVTSDTDESNFYPVEPDGTQSSWTSYMPGEWFNAAGEGANYSTGINYWQWYIWTGRDGIYYDYGGGTDKAYNGLFLVGGAPGNVAGAADALSGTTVTSKAKLIAGGEAYDFIVNINYSEYVSEKKATGSGNLIYPADGGDVETTSKYNWVLHETEGLTIDVEINTEEWQETGDWTIGFIPDLTQEFVQGILGFDPGALTDEEFYPLNPDGTKVAWSSYAPGMWIDNAGASSDWSAGIAYWQWYVRSEQYYDYGYENRPGIFLFGGNPGNVSKIEFETPIVSKAVMKGLPVTITYIYHDVILPETEGYPEAVFEETGLPYPYGGGVYGDHTIQWYFSEEGLTVDVDAYLPAIDDWGYLATVIPPEVMTAYLGIEDIEQLYDITYFHPLDSEDWTSYKPGQWVYADGSAGEWSGGAMYWQYQFGEHKYDGHFTEGLLVIGTNPGNAATLGGQTVTSVAQLGDKLMTVNVHYYDTYPTSKETPLYNWLMDDSGIYINANMSLSKMDDSWAWMGFFLNEAYINAKFGVDIAALATSLDTFYPVAPDGTPYTKWSSYVPGEWFLEDGSEGAWNTGVSFWQYYTSNFADLGSHDFTSPNLFYVGKNPGYSFQPGSYVSKAKVADYAFNFTINIAE